MILRYAHLRRHPAVFLAMTGLRGGEFDALVDDVLPALGRAEVARLSQPTRERPVRQRAIGAGHPFGLDARDQVLLTVVWLRQYPTHPVLGYLFGVSRGTVDRTLPRVLPVLEANGRDTMRTPEPGRTRQRSRRTLEALLHDVPALAVLVDTFEQRVQRPPGRGPDGTRRADAYFSGKQKRHTLKSQVAVDATTGAVVDVADSVPGRTNDLTLLRQSRLLDRLPPALAVGGDLAYVGIATDQPPGRASTPRRKPREHPRPPEDIAYNTAFARQRVVVEHTIGRLRRYQALTQLDRHHRHHHTARVRAIGGLVNRQLRHRFPC